MASKDTKKVAVEAKAVEAPKKEETKVAAKKAPAKKAPAKKAEIKTNVLLQFANKEVAEKDIIANVKKAWTAQTKGKIKDIKTIDIYVKTEEHKAYFVVNGESQPEFFVEL